MVVDYIVEHRQNFKPFFSQKDDANFDEYYEKMVEDKTWEDCYEIYVASMVTQTNMHVHEFQGNVS